MPQLSFFQVILEDRKLGEFNDFLRVDQEFMNDFVLEYVFRHNYTMNREATVQAIKDHYTYFPDPSDDNAVRQKFIEVNKLFCYALL